MTQSILFLTPQVPYPPYQGTALRNFGLLKGLAERGHAVSLLSFEAQETTPETMTVLEALCDQVVLAPVPPRSKLKRIVDLARGHTDMARRLWSAGFKARLELLLELHRFDIVHVEGIEMAPYIPTIMGHAKIIYDAHNAEATLQQRIAEQAKHPVRKGYSQIQANRLKHWEAEVCQVSDHVLAVSERDAEHLAAFNSDTPITVLPNAIDVSAYSPETVPADVPHPALVFTGKMDFRPNVDAMLWFANEILPLIHEQQPNAHLLIVGKKPHPRLKALRSQPNITLTGFVSAVEPYIAAADIYIAPLRMGSGTRFKLLQAMAMQRPIISTVVGAEGLNAQDGEHLLIANSVTEFADTILNLLDSPDQIGQLTHNAYEFVRYHYDWPAVLPTLEEVYQKITA